MPVPVFRGKRVLVLGLGLHGGGVAVVRWLSRHGARVTVSDLKTKAQLAPSLQTLRGLRVKYYLGQPPVTRLLRGCEFIVQNPAVPRELPFLKLARQRKIPIENEATLFLKLCPAKVVIGVTGSKGKSTTTALLGKILAAWKKNTIVAGNIRDTVMFDALPRIKPGTIVALELSSWHLEVMGQKRMRLPIAVVTNVTEEHLNRYSSFVSYVRAKRRLIQFQRPEDAAILNYDNPETRKFARHTVAGVYWFSKNKSVARGSYVKGSQVYWRNGARVEKLFSVSDVRMLGEHNLENALAAATAARLAGVPARVIRAAVGAFNGLHDRMELVKKVNKVDYINDTAATAPQAVCAALAALAPRSVVLIAGGVDKNLNYRTMAQSVRRLAKAVVMLPGTATVKLQRELRGYKPQLLAKSMAEAVRLASRLAPAGGVVLLSPGAASFNMFLHEFHRGQEFKRAVLKL